MDGRAIMEFLLCRRLRIPPLLPRFLHLTSLISSGGIWYIVKADICVLPAEVRVRGGRSPIRIAEYVPGLGRTDF